MERRRGSGWLEDEKEDVQDDGDEDEEEQKKDKEDESLVVVVVKNEEHYKIDEYEIKMKMPKCWRKWRLLSQL